MPFKPQTKRFALVPVEPGNEKDTDVTLMQNQAGNVHLEEFQRACGGSWLYWDDDREAIAALGFPTEGEKA